MNFLEVECVILNVKIFKDVFYGECELNDNKNLKIFVVNYLDNFN